MRLRVLLVESEPEDVFFLRDVLTEIESERCWSPWVQFEILHAATVNEATGVLAGERVDVILLDQRLGAFGQLQGAAPEVPVILLSEPGDEALAVHAVRAGAQDFLFRHQVDCKPLAHAIRNAIERHRLLTAARAGAIHDALTGLPNRGGFLTFANRDCKLAELLCRRLMILVAEPQQITAIADVDGEQRRDLILVETAERLRSLAGATGVLGRIGPARFAIAVFDTEAESVEEAWARMYAAAAEFRIQIGASIFDADRPMSLDELLEQAEQDLAPTEVAMRP